MFYQQNRTRVWAASSVVILILLSTVTYLGMMRFRSSTVSKAVQPTAMPQISPKPTIAKPTPTSSVILGNGDKNVEFQKEEIRFTYPDNWNLNGVDPEDGSVSVTATDGGKLSVYYKGIPKTGVKRKCQTNKEVERKEVNGKVKGTVIFNSCEDGPDDSLIFSGKNGGSNVTVVYEYPKGNGDGAKNDFNKIVDTIDTGGSGNSGSSGANGNSTGGSNTNGSSGGPSPSGNSSGNTGSSGPTGPTGNTDDSGVIPDCSNTLLGLTVKAPFPSASWYCLSKAENGEEGWIDIKSDLFTIRLSNLTRGPFCGNMPENRLDCTISPFYSNKITDLYTYNFQGQDKEIFGILNYRFQKPGANKIWQSIIYTDMESRKLTQNEKDELTKVLDAIMQLSP